MESIFINSENSKTSSPHVLALKLTSKLDLRLREKVIALSNLSIYYTWRNIKSSYSNNKFKISAPAWNDEFKLPEIKLGFCQIYNFTCGSCNASYIGKTFRHMKVRVSEHQGISPRTGKHLK